MATFEAKVYKLKIEPHPNADKLELAAVGDYRAVVQKGIYKTGNLGVYVQEGSIVPKWLLEKYQWKLAGPDANRVKAIRLRDIMSQGIVIPVYDVGDVEAQGGHSPWLRDADNHIIFVHEGDDIAAELGITKYEPPIPVHMSGEVFNAFGYTINFDIENIKKFPDVFNEGDLVVMTEKLHGTWTCLGYHPAVGDIVTSKGLSGSGLAFKMNEANKDNLYIRSLRSTENGYEFSHDGEDTIVGKKNVIERMFELTSGMEPFYILGETFGKGVQDLTYGTDKPQFRVFDIYLGEPGKGRYLHFAELTNTCEALNVEIVPIVYHGPYSKEMVNVATNGKETFSGKESNLREGVVIKPVIERRNDLIGRVMLKSVSDAYLLRKGNVTELT